MYLRLPFECGEPPVLNWQRDFPPSSLTASA